MFGNIVTKMFIQALMSRPVTKSPGKSNATFIGEVLCSYIYGDVFGRCIMM